MEGEDGASKMETAAVPSSVAVAQKRRSKELNQARSTSRKRSYLPIGVPSRLFSRRVLMARKSTIGAARLSRPSYSRRYGPLANLREELLAARIELQTERHRYLVLQDQLQSMHSKIVLHLRGSASGAVQTLADMNASAKRKFQRTRQQERKVRRVETTLNALEFRAARQEEAYFITVAAAHQATKEPMLEPFPEPGDVLSDEYSVEDIPQILEDYYEEVGTINMLREHLNDFEIEYRKEVLRRKMLGEEYREPPEKEFEVDYLRERHGMVERLLEAKAKAQGLQTQCIVENIPPENPGEPNLLDEAVKYRLPGEIGKMYAMESDEKHHGFSPIELLLVPREQREDRVSEWQRNLIGGHLQPTQRQHPAPVSDSGTLELNLSLSSELVSQTGPATTLDQLSTGSSTDIGFLESGDIPTARSESRFNNSTGDVSSQLSDPSPTSMYDTPRKRRLSNGRY
ncbi:hypothetical protein NA57DRAFT_51037 [Rhizodiscina lignyota]|uniref:Uncharacterized protein n=1 Tax=Rhizodiscina lignyota TaxID=1504668 RepID=A0A9P4ITH9_9PEZI|nr:hypothetical protein NA57DRAFT_51037 [Rhizodiscina lignyota]